MFNSLSLFSSISLGCSIGYGLGGASRQIKICLTEAKESLEDNVRTFVFKDRDRTIQVTHIESGDKLDDRAIITCDGKKYIFKLTETGGQLIATCGLFPNISFVFSICGHGRVMCSQLSVNGRNYLSVDTVAVDKETGMIEYDSFGMELDKHHVNWKGVTSFMKQQMAAALLIHAYDSCGSFEQIPDLIYGDLTVLANRYSGALIFHYKGLEHVVCVRGCVNHTVEITCGGTMGRFIRYVMLLPNRNERNIFTIVKYVNGEETEQFVMDVDNHRIIVMRDNDVVFEYKYTIESTRVAFSKEI